MEKDIERFLRYVQIDTQSDDTSDTVPSTAKQLNLTRLLQKELNEMGVENEIDEFGVLYAHIPGEEGLDPIGLNAHVDTALELPGLNVKPQVIHSYDGGTIRLNDSYSMSPADFPSLGEHIGDDLVVTSGDTLLGADDKAGIAAIMAVTDYFLSHPEIKHHPICICFTPDEEIGRGPDHFDAKKFGAKYAYTVDGANWDVVSFETFNAAHADVIIHGFSIHPGEAKGKLVNASNVAMAFDGSLPALKRPQFTSGREGFNHLVGIEGNVDECRMHYIIRNHDAKKLEEQKQSFLAAAENVRGLYPAAKVEVILGNDYRNMGEVFEEHPEAVNKVKAAFASLGVTPIEAPIRGGTDGATFSFKGCPTPNLGTGSYNHHGRYEYLSVQEFRKVVNLLITIYKA